MARIWSEADILDRTDYGFQGSLSTPEVEVTVRMTSTGVTTRTEVKSTSRGFLDEFFLSTKIQLLLPNQQAKESKERNLINVYFRQTFDMDFRLLVLYSTYTLPVQYVRRYIEQYCVSKSLVAF